MQSLDFYRDRLQIDRNALDDELASQSQLFWEVGEGYVLCTGKRDALKVEVSRLHSQLGLTERLALAEAGLKVTEASIEERVLTNADMIAVGNSYLTAKANADTWATMKESYTQRSYALKDLVALYIAGYFGDVTPKRASDVIDDRKHEERREGLTRQRQALVEKSSDGG